MLEEEAGSGICSRIGLNWREMVRTQEGDQCLQRPTLHSIPQAPGEEVVGMRENQTLGKGVYGRPQGEGPEQVCVLEGTRALALAEINGNISVTGIKCGHPQNLPLLKKKIKNNNNKKTYFRNN